MSRGFAFVEIITAEDAEAAISELHGAEVMGRVLKVALAKPRESSGAGTERLGLSAMRNESSQNGGTAGSDERGQLGRLMQRRFKTVDVLTRRKAAGGYRPGEPHR